MSEKKLDLREAELGGFWSTSNENVFNGTIDGREVLLVRNLNKNNNTKYPEFRLYDKKEYNLLIIQFEIDKKKLPKGDTHTETLTEKENEYFLEIHDIDSSGGF